MTLLFSFEVNHHYKALLRIIQHFAKNKKKNNGFIIHIFIYYRMILVYIKLNY